MKGIASLRGVKHASRMHASSARLRTLAAALCAVAAGCSAPGTAPLPSEPHFSTGDDASSAATDSGAPESTTTGPAHLWTVDQVEDSLRLLFVDDVPNGHDFIDLFRELTAAGDASCPGADLAFTTPEGSCTSSNGTEYFGFAPYLDEVSSASGAEVHTVAIPQASFVITTATGDTFSAGGGFIHEQCTSGDGSWVQEFAGTFIWTGEGYPWMQAGTQVGWSIRGTRDGPHHTMSVHGPIAVGTSWAFVETLAWDNEACGSVPTAEIWVRDDHGRWYDWTAGADCSPCGTVRHAAPDGTVHDLGALCLDLTPTLEALDTDNDFPVGR